MVKKLMIIALLSTNLAYAGGEESQSVEAASVIKEFSETEKAENVVVSEQPSWTVSGVIWNIFTFGGLFSRSTAPVNTGAVSAEDVKLPEELKAVIETVKPDANLIKDNAQNNDQITKDVRNLFE